MSKRFSRKAIPDEDAALLAEIADRPFRPVFIMGLHRSGTTFLYECMAQAYSLPYLSIHGIIFYPRLLARHQAQRTHEDEQALDDYFESLGMSTRGIDGVSLSHATPEEYGWLLNRFGGSLFLDDDTAPLLRDVCRKLCEVKGNDRDIVLKNPSDAAHAPRMKRLFPDARFVYIARDALEILSSQLMLHVYVAANPSAYLRMLLEGSPMGRLWFGLQRAIYLVGGRKALVRFMLPRLSRAVTSDLAAMRDSVAGIPEDCHLEVNYRELVEYPAETLGRIGDFLGLSPTMDLTDIESRPRKSSLAPEVMAVREEFLALLDAQGLAP